MLGRRREEDLGPEAGTGSQLGILRTSRSVVRVTRQEKLAESGRDSRRGCERGTRNDDRFRSAVSGVWMRPANPLFALPGAALRETVMVGRGQSPAGLNVTPVPRRVALGSARGTMFGSAVDAREVTQRHRRSEADKPRSAADLTTILIVAGAMALLWRCLV